MQEVAQVFEWNQLLGPLGGTLALALFSGMGVGYRFAVGQNRLTKEYITNMLEITNKKLEESDRRNAELDKMCQERVDSSRAQVREDIESLTKRHTLEINSIRAAHKDEVETLRSILENVMNRLDEITHAKE